MSFQPKSQESSCRLLGLSRWSAQTHLAGLKVDAGHLLLDASYFACCGGVGMELMAGETMVARRCGLIERISRLTALTQQMAQLDRGVSAVQAFGLTAPDTKTSQQSQVMTMVERWRRLHGAALCSDPTGRLIADAVACGPNLTDTWASLATFIWHEGILPLVHVQGRGVPPLSQWTTYLREKNTTRSVIVMEGVGQLWDAKFLDEFEQIVSFASMARIPLWIVLSPKFKTESADQSRGAENQASTPSNASKVGSNRFASAMDKRIHKYKQGGLEQWISPATLARLSEVCILPRRV